MHTKSAAKQWRKSEKRRLANRAARHRILTARKQFLAAIESRDRNAALGAFRHYASLLDKAVKQGRLKPNNASRHKSRAAHYLARLGPPTAPAASATKTA